MDVFLYIRFHWEQVWRWHANTKITVEFVWHYTETVLRIKAKYLRLTTLPICGSYPAFSYARTTDTVRWNYY